MCSNQIASYLFIFLWLSGEICQCSSKSKANTGNISSQIIGHFPLWTWWALILQKIQNCWAKKKKKAFKNLYSGIAVNFMWKSASFEIIRDPCWWLLWGWSSTARAGHRVAGDKAHRPDRRLQVSLQTSGNHCNLTLYLSQSETIS